MKGYLTYCYCNQESEKFEREWIKNDGKLWQKSDPNFEQGTYSECHQKLRERIQIGDYLFFRTNWRNTPHIIGYFLISDKKNQNKFEGPQLIAKEHLCIDFNLHIDAELLLKLDPNQGVFTKDKKKGQYTWPLFVNLALNRNYKILNEEKTKNLIKIICHNGWA